MSNVAHNPKRSSRAIRILKGVGYTLAALFFAAVIYLGVLMSTLEHAREGSPDGLRDWDQTNYLRDRALEAAEIERTKRTESSVDSE